MESSHMVKERKWEKYEYLTTFSLSYFDFNALKKNCGQKLYNIMLIIKFCKLYCDPVKQVFMTICAKLDTPQG